MNKKTFFANAASKALALAATVMMMSAAFTACSSSNDDPTTEPKANTVTLDGEEKPILEAGYQYWGDGNYVLFFSLSASSQERVRLGLNKELHITGNPINLTKKEEKHDGKWYWGVIYSDYGNSLFDTWGAFGSSNTIFDTGTLTMSGDPTGTINIKLENGRVMGKDGKEHTLVLSYSGTMTMEYVDLGLSVKWARCNLGASKPSDYGDYYAWGETEPKTNYTWATYKWGTENNFTKYNATDGKIVLDPEDDAATVNLGSPWHMPTGDEIKELLENCTYTETTQDGVNGYEVKSKKNGNTIFLPTAGYRRGSELVNAGGEGSYWLSSLSVRPYAYILSFFSRTHDMGFTHRYAGFPVRPVRP